MGNDDATHREQCACANERTADIRQWKRACKNNRTVIAACTQTMQIACKEIELRLDPAVRMQIMRNSENQSNS